MFYTYKIFEKVNGYYYYFISHIDYLDLNFNTCESYADAMPDVPINQYFNIITGWSEDADIEKCDNISPIQVINKQFPTNDSKNMNISDEYKKILSDEFETLQQKKSRSKKTKDPKDPNDAKPKAKAAKPKVKQESTKVNIESGQVLNFN